MLDRREMLTVGSLGIAAAGIAQADPSRQNSVLFQAPQRPNPRY